MAFLGEDSLNTVKEKQHKLVCITVHMGSEGTTQTGVYYRSYGLRGTTHSGVHYSSYGLSGKIHSSKLKVFGVDIIWKVIEAYLRLCAGVEHKLIEKSILCLAEIVLIVLRNLSCLILQTLDHL